MRFVYLTYCRSGVAVPADSAISDRSDAAWRLHKFCVELGRTTLEYSTIHSSLLPSTHPALPYKYTIESGGKMGQHYPT